MIGNGNPSRQHTPLDGRQPNSGAIREQEEQVQWTAEPKDNTRNTASRTERMAKSVLQEAQHRALCGYDAARPSHQPRGVTIAIWRISDGMTDRVEIGRQDKPGS